MKFLSHILSQDLSERRFFDRPSLFSAAAGLLAQLLNRLPGSLVLVLALLLAHRSYLVQGLEVERARSAGSLHLLLDLDFLQFTDFISLIVRVIKYNMMSSGIGRF